MALVSPDSKEAPVSITAHGDDQSNGGDTPKSRENRWVQLMTALRWYRKDMAAEEKQLVMKLDLSILIFGCISFFTKYLDQQSITNAFVR